MSEPMRYNIKPGEEGYEIAVSLGGEWVHYSDYARLKAEVERLRKAGDAMHKSMLECGPNEMAEEFDHDRWWASYYGWRAAKETPPHA